MSVLQRRFGRRLAGAGTLILASAFVLAMPGAVAISSGASVTTFGYGNARTGQNTVTGTITGVSSAPAWNKQLDGAVYGEPLLYGGHVLVATENDSIYALNPHTGAVVWHLHTGTAVAKSMFDQGPSLNGCGDINPLGITGTPVIDKSTNTLYAVEETMVGSSRWQNIRHVMVAVDLGRARVRWSRKIDPPLGNQLSHGGYTIPALQQRPALTLTAGRVYANFGGLAGDCGIYHGYVIGVPATGTGNDLVYKVPTQTEGAIWATPGAVVSPQGNLYVSTGNGSSTSTFDGGNAVVELSPTLHVLGEWAPPNWANLSAEDWDLGSSGVIYVPGSSLLFISGKPQNGSFGYLISSTSLGSGPSAALFSGDVCTDPNTGVFGGDASAMVSLSGTPTPVIFAACQNGTEALAVTTAGSPSFTQLWGPTSTSSGGTPIVAGGLVWSLDYNNYSLVALKPATGQVMLQRSTTALNHFATPHDW